MKINVPIVLMLLAAACCFAQPSFEQKYDFELIDSQSIALSSTLFYFFPIVVEFPAENKTGTPIGSWTIFGSAILESTGNFVASIGLSSQDGPGFLGRVLFEFKDSNEQIIHQVLLDSLEVNGNEKRKIIYQDTVPLPIVFFTKSLEVKPSKIDQMAKIMEENELQEIEAELRIKLDEKIKRANTTEEALRQALFLQNSVLKLEHLEVATKTEDVPQTIFHGLSLEKVLHKLDSAFATCGYPPVSHFHFPYGDGFVIITRLEQMDEKDGTSKSPPERWSTDVINIQSCSFTTYVKALMFGSEGYSRIMAFIISNKDMPFKPHLDPAGPEDVEEVFQKGTKHMNMKEFGDTVFDSNYRCTVWVYEFKISDLDNVPSKLKNSIFPDHLNLIHLEKSFILQNL